MTTKENYPSMLLVKAERQGNQRQIIKAKRNGSLIFSGSKKESSVAGVWDRQDLKWLSWLGMWTWSQKAAVHQRLRSRCKGRWLRNREGSQGLERTPGLQKLCWRKGVFQNKQHLYYGAVYTETGKGEVRLDLWKERWAWGLFLIQKVVG